MIATITKIRYIAPTVEKDSPPTYWDLSCILAVEVAVAPITTQAVVGTVASVEVEVAHAITVHRGNLMISPCAEGAAAAVP